MQEQHYPVDNVVLVVLMVLALPYDLLLRPIKWMQPTRHTADYIFQGSAFAIRPSCLSLGSYRRRYNLNTRLIIQTHHK